MNREIRNVKNVPWQLTAVLLGLFFGLPLSIGGSWGLLDAKGQGSSTLAAIAAVPGYLMLLWGALGMRSRVRQATAGNEPAGPIIKRMLLGAGVIIGTVAIASIWNGVLETPLVVVWLPACAGMMVGVVLILRATIPSKRKATYAPLGVPKAVSSSTVAGVTSAPDVTIPPRPRRNG